MASKMHAAMNTAFTSPRLFGRSCGRFSVVLATLCLLAGGGLHAETADRLKPMHAEADALRYDDARQLSVFTGNVVITKGTIVIRGDRVEVRQDSQGHQFGVVTGTAGTPAFFRQKREGIDEHIEGVAERIEYNGQTDVVRFERNAVMRRYRGTVLADETTGSLIVYNNASETFSVDGGQASRSPANPSGRVRAMLSPTPKPAAATAGPQPDSQRLPLRPSGQIDGATR
jgi:lipopolysaccharide export system protein LptA